MLFLSFTFSVQPAVHPGMLSFPDPGQGRHDLFHQLDDLFTLVRPLQPRAISGRLRVSG